MKSIGDVINGLVDRWSLATAEQDEERALKMPRGAMVSGLEYDGQGTFYAGGGKSGKLRAVRRPPQR